jgi:UDP-N-acetylmuramoyl-tripeptide--D-alanyl-D-alanine ligase
MSKLKFDPKSCIEQFQDIVSDSRKVKPNSLFFAIKGELKDGHEFIESAIHSGAKAIVCEESFKNLDELIKRHTQVDFFTTDNSLKAYRECARLWRKKFNCPIVVVAGSVGKTTTKQMLSSVLSVKFSNCVVTEGSQNGFLGIPMTLFKINQTTELAIIEVGIDECGAMKDHLDIVFPTHALITKIAEEHLHNLKNIETVAYEETEVFRWMARENQSGCVFIRLDDKWQSPYLEYFKNHQFKNFVVSGNKISAEIISETECRVLQGKYKDQVFSSPLIGEHNVSNLILVLSVCEHFNLSVDEIKLGLEKNFKPEYGRTNIIKKDSEVAKNITFICDYYNANPESMKAAFKLGFSFKQKHNTSLYACLGDMLELGEKEALLHRELAQYLKQYGFDKVFLFGKNMLFLHDELKKINFNSYHFNTHKDLAVELKKHLKSNAIVLIKGSRGMKMEKVLEEI